MIWYVLDHRWTPNYGRCLGYRKSEKSITAKIKKHVNLVLLLCLYIYDLKWHAQKISSHEIHVKCAINIAICNKSLMHFNMWFQSDKIRSNSNLTRNLRVKPQLIFNHRWQAMKKWSWIIFVVIFKQPGDQWVQDYLLAQLPVVIY